MYKRAFFVPCLYFVRAFGYNGGMKKTLCALPLLAAFFSCNKTPPLSPEEAARLARERDEAARAQAIADYVAALPVEQKLSQLFLVNVEGNERYAPVETTGALYGERGEGAPLAPGGCLLFSYNIADSAEKIASYTASVQRFYREHGMVPPYIAIDQEGGDVNRLRRITSTLVSQKKTVEWFTPEEAYRIYSAQARQLRVLGIQLNLAPVVEVETSANSAFLETRTFGALDAVLAYGDAEVRAYEENGVAVVLKHFPGNSNTDPHTGLPRITFSADEWDTYFRPFEALLPKASAVLMSHAIVQERAGEGAAPSVPQEATAMPACFSRYWVTDTTRTRFGFDGVIFSDDIFMGALANNGYAPDVAAIAAVEAGVNCIMLSEKNFGSVAGWLLAKATEDAHFAALVDESARRMIAFKVKLGLLDVVAVAGSADDVAGTGSAAGVVGNAGVGSATGAVGKQSGESATGAVGTASSESATGVAGNASDGSAVGAVGTASSEIAATAIGKAGTGSATGAVGAAGAESATGASSAKAGTSRASAAAGNKSRATAIAAPAYVVVPRPLADSFDAAAFKAAYDDGMAFYK